MDREYRLFGIPGSGKTTELMKKIAAAVESFGPDRVAACSFTTAAAKNLLSRGVQLEKDACGTLHHFAFVALGRPKVFADSYITKWNEAHPEYMLSVDDPGNTGQQQKAGDALYHKYQVCRAKMVPIDQGRVADFARVFDQWKGYANVCDFTDMIDKALSVDCMPGEPAAAFFDEAQDFSPMQLALVRKWGAKMEYYWLAGDDEQAIYTFQGADPAAFLYPDIPVDRKEYLTTSYRCPRVVMDKAQRIASKLSIREPKEYHPRDEEGKIGWSAGLGSQWATVEDVAMRVRQGKTVMILTSCDYMLGGFAAELKKAGIPYWNPYAENRGWNPLHPSQGISVARRIAAFLSGPDFIEEDFNLMLPLLKDKCFCNAARPEGVGGDIPAMMLPWWFTPDCIDAIMNKDLQYLEGNMYAKYAKSAQYPFQIYRKMGLSALRNKPLVILGTIHSVKGGQADCVFLCPDLSSAGQESYLDDRDSVIRQFYVGMTRAREELILCRPKRNGAYAFQW